MIRAILHGAAVTTEQSRALMPSFAKVYSDQEIAALAKFVVAQFGGQQGKASAKTVAEARRQ